MLVFVCLENFWGIMDFWKTLFFSGLSMLCFEFIVVVIYIFLVVYNKVYDICFLYNKVFVFKYDVDFVDIKFICI